MARWPVGRSRHKILFVMPLHGVPKFELERLTSYDDESLLAEVRRVSAIVPDRTLTTSAFAEHAKVHISTLYNRFGSWKSALEAAGVADRFEKREWSREEIVETLKTVAAQLGRSNVSLRDAQKTAGITFRPIARHFGDFRAALKAAGLTAATSGQRYSDEECFENLLIVWTALGRQPNYAEMKAAPSRVGPKAYVRRWGSWRAALAGFIQRVNADAPEVATTEVPGAPAVEADLPGRRTGREIPLGLRYKVLVRDSFRCILCGRSPATHPAVVLHVDHFLAWSNGGETVIENLRALCSDCNLGKGSAVEGA
jgi:hypothetical protein